MWRVSQRVTNCCYQENKDWVVTTQNDQFPLKGPKRSELWKFGRNAMTLMTAKETFALLWGSSRGGRVWPPLCTARRASWDSGHSVKKSCFPELYKALFSGLLSCVSWQKSQHENPKLAWGRRDSPVGKEPVCLHSSQVWSPHTSSTENESC